MSAHIAIDANRIAEFCRRWNIKEFALFGSVLREDFGPRSDIDVLVTFSPESRRSLFDMVRMQNELEDVFGREVDLVSRNAVDVSRNHVRRHAILSSAEIIHAA